MNKTITANVGGFVFNIEEQAYESLSRYLAAVRRSLGADECVDEIMQDIEHRIAELFREFLQKEHKEVIGQQNVAEVIAIMGEPAAFAQEESRTENEQASTTWSDEQTDKQFFRDSDNSMIGGVCSGISAYFGWDPLFLRILFVILMIGFGSGLLLYVILWIIIPEAKTTSEKLRMRGKKVDVETIKQRFNDFKKDVEHLSTPEGKRKMRRASSRMADAMSESAKNFYDIFGRALGGVLLILGLLFLIWLIKATISSSFMISLSEQGITAVNFEEFGNAFFGTSTRTNLVYFAVIGLILMPILGLLFAAVRLLFRIPFKTKAIGAVMGLITSACFITLTVIGIQTGTDFAKENSQVTTTIIQTNSDTLYLDSSSDIYFSDHFKHHDDTFFELLKFEEKEIVYGYPLVDVEQSPDSNFRVNINREARGSNQTEAISRAKNIDYQFAVQDSLVTFNPWFSSPRADLIRGQQLKVNIQIPNGKTIHLSQRSDRIIYDIQNEEDLSDEDMVGFYWTMKEKNLHRK